LSNTYIHIILKDVDILIFIGISPKEIVTWMIMWVEILMHSERLFDGNLISLSWQNARNCLVIYLFLIWNFWTLFTTCRKFVVSTFHVVTLINWCIVPYIDFVIDLDGPSAYTSHCFLCPMIIILNLMK
jgi:hypothetical protein